MVQVVILAGGLATRLRPVTETIPKSLIEINGKPFIFHQLQFLKSKGVSKVLICTGYLGHMIEELIGNGKQWGMDISYSYDGETLLGTGGAVNKAYPLLDDVFAITYGDSYLDFSYELLSDFFFSESYPAVMTIFENKNAHDKSNVIFEDSILQLYSKKNHSPSMKYIDYGFSIVQKMIFANRGEGDIFDLSEVFEDLAIQKKLGAFLVFNRFYEIGSFQGIKDLELYLNNK